MSAAPHSALRDIAIVAGNELAEALRSRRVLILALLFVGGAVAGTLAFVELLASLEAGIAEALMVSGAGKPGAVSAELIRSPAFLHALGRLVDDAQLAEELAALPPLALFYGWLGLSFLPVLVMLTATETVSAELATGSARFSLLRTSRLEFSIGKLAGQTLLVVASIAAGAVAVWCTGFFALSSFEAGRTALWLLLLSLRVAFYAFAYIGLAVGLSHLTRSVPLSRALGLFALILFWVLFGVGTHLEWIREHAPGLADSLLVVLPRSHQLGLWRPELVDRLPSLVMLVALGVVYFTLGYRFRARRDA